MATAGDILVRYSGKWILAVLALTLLLVVPLIAMAPDEDASSDPGGGVFDVQDDLGDWFDTFVHAQSYVIEARRGDVLTQAVLWEIYQNTQELLAADARGELRKSNFVARQWSGPRVDGLRGRSGKSARISYDDMVRNGLERACHRVLRELGRATGGRLANLPDFGRCPQAPGADRLVLGLKPPPANPLILG